MSEALFAVVVPAVDLEEGIQPAVVKGVHDNVDGALLQHRALSEQGVNPEIWKGQDAYAEKLDLPLE